MNTENVTIDWPTYTDHVREMLNEMLLSNDLMDVTLVCNDMKQLKAHKIVLSACSPVFQNILTDHIQESLVIFLGGIQYQEMESNLEFMYSGEATFSEERMNEFLSVARSLEIKEISMDEKSYQNRTSASKSSDNDQNFETKMIDYQSKQFEAEWGHGIEDNVNFDTLVTNKSELHKTVNNETDIVAILNCDHCESQYAGKDNLYKHLLSKHKIVMNATTPSGPIDDPKTKHKVVKYSCSECEFFTLYKAGLRKHIEMKHECVRYLCQQCEYQFTDRSALKNHIQFKHEGKFHCCNECDKTYGTASHLKEHIQTKHTGVKYDCILCDKKFVFKSGLKKQILTSHEGVRYDCGQCGYQAQQQYSLKTHIQSKHEGHIGEKFLCSQCEFHTKNKYTLKYHIQSKHEGNVHCCNECDKKYGTASHLKQHVQTKHTDVKYDCILCDKKFAFKSGVKRHIMTMHESVGYEALKLMSQT